MAEMSFLLEANDKQAQYEELAIKIGALIEGEHDEISVLANVAAALHEALGLFWVGFYVVKGGHLVLGPFQGSVACYRIGHGRGVCGTAWAQARTVVVPDVEQFEGHIACSSLSKSEIVIPLKSSNQTEQNNERKVRAVLDIDSDQINAFDDIDREGIEKICQIVEKAIY